MFEYLHRAILGKPQPKKDKDKKKRKPIKVISKKKGVECEYCG